MLSECFCRDLYIYRFWQMLLSKVTFQVCLPLIVTVTKSHDKLICKSHTPFGPSHRQQSDSNDGWTVKVPFTGLSASLPQWHWSVQKKAYLQISLYVCLSQHHFIYMPWKFSPPVFVKHQERWQSPGIWLSHMSEQCDCGMGRPISTC